MKNLILTVGFLLLISSFINAQTAANSASKNVIYVEVGTYLLISGASINYDFHLKSLKEGKINLYGRGGLGGTAVFYGPAGLGGLGGVTMLTGKKNHHFEASLGAFVGNDNGQGYGDGLFVLPLLDLGYRFQKPQKGFVFRAKAGILGVGIGLGYSF